MDRPLKLSRLIYLFFITLTFFISRVGGVDVEDLDVLTSYIAVLNRGLVFEREEIIFGHSQMKLMTAIITLDRLIYNNNFENDFCKRELNMVDHKFNKTMERYREITYAIFQAKNMFTTSPVPKYALFLRDRTTPRFVKFTA